MSAPPTARASGRPAAGNDAARETPEDEQSTPADEMTAEAMAGPVGPGCADYAAQVPDSEGSVEGMSDEPVAVAASNNPVLTTLVSAVSPGRLAPDEVIGEQVTVQGGPVTVAGTPDAMTVNDADVVCGGVATANATVYLIDGVLTPPA